MTFIIDQSNALFQQAKCVIPGGVNSPVRAFQSVKHPPIFIKSGQGAEVTDVDGQNYIDYVGSWGPLLLGHACPEIVEAVQKVAKCGLTFGACTPYEVEYATELCHILPNIEQIRMVSSGTEAIMSAIRLARGYTKRTKIIKFTGCYHGHSDGLLVQAGSGVLTAGLPGSAGVPAAFTELTIPCRYNDVAQLETIFKKMGDEIACVIVEPVAANMGVCLPKPGFLESIRTLTTQYGALLIFDEVITGFRLGLGGAQAYFGVDADLVTYGKIIGGGLPVGAYGGRREIMECVAPCGPVYQAGTLSGNPLAMVAGLSMLKLLQAQAETLYDRIERYTRTLVEGIHSCSAKWQVPVQVNHIGSLFSCFFTEDPVYNESTSKASNTEAYRLFFYALLKQGIYVSPSQFEAWFISGAHSDQHLEKTLIALDHAFEFVSKEMSS